MKKCDYFKDLILTDYIDGELDKNLAGELESHLLDCGDCRAFLKEVKTLPLPCSANVRLALRQPVPAELWDAIKQNIEHENQKTSPVADFVDQLKGLIVFPRLVPVFASLVIMLLAGSVTLNTVLIQQAKDKDQGEYLVSLLSQASPASVDNNDGETPMEHYFL